MYDEKESFPLDKCKMEVNNSELKVWVRMEDRASRSVIFRIPSDYYVSDLIEDIKGKLSDELTGIGLSQIFLHGPEPDRKEGGEHKDGEGGTDYEPDILVSAILAEGVGRSDPDHSATRYP